MPLTIPTTPGPADRRLAAGYDYGLYLDSSDHLQVFGDRWAYNLPEPSTATYKAVVAAEEPQAAPTPALDPSDPGYTPYPPSIPRYGGFALTTAGAVVGIGHYDPNYWTTLWAASADNTAAEQTRNPTPADGTGKPDGYAWYNSITPSMWEWDDTAGTWVRQTGHPAIPAVTGATDISYSPELGLWIINSAGEAQQLYVSPDAPTPPTDIHSPDIPPTALPGNPTITYKAVSVGHHSLLILDSEGNIHERGEGRLDITGDYTRISMGDHHLVALESDGTVHQWDHLTAGSSAQTDLGVPSPALKLVDVHAGKGFTYGLDVNGEIHWWGKPLSETGSDISGTITDLQYDHISSAPPTTTWGFGHDTATGLFSTFGVGSVLPPVLPGTPDPPDDLMVINFGHDAKNEPQAVKLSWDVPPSGLPDTIPDPDNPGNMIPNPERVAGFRIAKVPRTGPTAPATLPPGTTDYPVPTTGGGSPKVTAVVAGGHYEVEYAPGTTATAGDYWYMVQSVGDTGAKSAWRSVSFDSTTPGDIAQWRKATLTYIGDNCGKGGFELSLNIDQPDLGKDGWTGTGQILDDQIPPGVVYLKVGEKITVSKTATVGDEDIRGDVNGLDEIEISKVMDGPTYAVIDYEIAIDSEYRYWVRHSEEPLATEESNSLVLGPLSENCQNVQYLRDLLDPNGEVSSEFCLGTLESLDYSIRSGIFQVLGRRAPVVVVDARTSSSGTLRLISQDRSQLHQLRRLLKLGHPMMLQVEHEYALANGMLYFQPQSITDRWALPNAKDPRHVLEVSFVEIDPPRGRIVLFHYGIPYSVAAGGILTRPDGYVEPINAPNGLFGTKFCDGGIREHFATYADMAEKTYSQAFHMFDNFDCQDIPDPTRALAGPPVQAQFSTGHNPYGGFAWGHPGDAGSGVPSDGLDISSVSVVSPKAGFTSWPSWVEFSGTDASKALANTGAANAEVHFDISSSGGALKPLLSVDVVALAGTQYQMTLYDSAGDVVEKSPLINRGGNNPLHWDLPAGTRAGDGYKLGVRSSDTGTDFSVRWVTIRWEG